MRLTCKQASRLISLGLDRELSFTQRMALRLHLSLCQACTRVKAQFDFLRRATSSYSDAADDSTPDRGTKR